MEVKKVSMKKILLILISDDNLPLNKMLNLHMLTVIVRCVLKKMANIIHNLSWMIFLYEV